MKNILAPRLLAEPNPKAHPELIEKHTWKKKNIESVWYSSLEHMFPNIPNYFTSSDPHRDIILKHICHKFWHSLC